MHRTYHPATQDLVDQNMMIIYAVRYYYIGERQSLIFDALVMYLFRWPDQGCGVWFGSKNAVLDHVCVASTFKNIWIYVFVAIFVCYFRSY